MLSKKDLNSADWRQCKFVTANGEVQTNEEATVHVKELDLFVAVKLPEDTLALLRRVFQNSSKNRRLL